MLNCNWGLDNSTFKAAVLCFLSLGSASLKTFPFLMSQHVEVTQQIPISSQSHEFNQHRFCDFPQFYLSFPLF